MTSSGVCSLSVISCVTASYISKLTSSNKHRVGLTLKPPSQIVAKYAELERTTSRWAEYVRSPHLIFKSLYLGFKSHLPQLALLQCITGFIVATVGGCIPFQYWTWSFYAQFPSLLSLRFCNVDSVLLGIVSHRLYKIQHLVSSWSIVYVQVRIWGYEDGGGIESGRTLILSRSLLICCSKESRKRKEWTSRNKGHWESHDKSNRIQRNKHYFSESCCFAKASLLDRPWSL